MAVHLQAGAPATTALDLWVVDPTTGLLVTPFAAEYQIFDLSDATKLATPVQVFPPAPGDAEIVDLVNDKLGEGHFVARWAADGLAPAGRYEIRWFVTLEDGGEEREIRETFDVIAGAVLTPLAQEGYALISELRAEGVPSSGAGAVTDAALQLRINMASRFIERCTLRRFLPRYVTDLPVDGSSMGALRFDDPIIAVSAVKRNYVDIAQPELLDVTLYAVYNRHITQGLQEPDDRADPRISFRDAAGYYTDGYPRSRTRAFERRSFVGPPQTYLVTGLFGYTDPDGSFVGGTPLGINEVCKRLVILWLTPLYTAAASGGGGPVNIASERTRDQSVTYGDTVVDKAGSGAWGEFSGDVLADQILATYRAVRVGMP